MRIKLKWLWNLLVHIKSYQNARILVPSFYWLNPFTSRLKQKNFTQILNRQERSFRFLNGHLLKFLRFEIIGHIKSLDILLIKTLTWFWACLDSTRSHFTPLGGSFISSPLLHLFFSHPEPFCNMGIEWAICHHFDIMCIRSFLMQIFECISESFIGFKNA